MTKRPEQFGQQVPSQEQEPVRDLFEGFDLSSDSELFIPSKDELKMETSLNPKDSRMFQVIEKMHKRVYNRGFRPFPAESLLEGLLENSPENPENYNEDEKEWIKANKERLLKIEAFQREVQKRLMEATGLPRGWRRWAEELGGKKGVEKMEKKWPEGDLGDWENNYGAGVSMSFFEIDLYQPDLGGDSSKAKKIGKQMIQYIHIRLPSSCSPDQVANVSKMIHDRDGLEFNLTGHRDHGIFTARQTLAIKKDLIEDKKL